MSDLTHNRACYVYQIFIISHLNAWERINMIWGKSVHARAWAHVRLQYHVSYLGINMFCVRSWKLCIVRFQNWRSMTNHNHKQQESVLGQNRTCITRRIIALPSPAQTSTQKDANVRRVSKLWVQAENPGENHWTIGCYNCQSCEFDRIFFTKLPRSTIEATIEARQSLLYKVSFVRWTSNS